MSSVKVFEDLTAPRLKFLNLMKQGGRFEFSGQEKGVFFFKFKEDNSTHCVRGLYEGGMKLQYSMNQIESCFVKQ